MANRGKGAALRWLVEHAGYDGDECLIWPFGTLSNGYASLSVDGSSMLATRKMCELAHGPAPADRPWSLHSCNNGHGGCVHPMHLRWGTPEENQADRVAAGTSNRGRGAKLSHDQVREIRSLKGTASRSELARRYGVSQGAIQGIQSGTNWKWLP